MTRSTFGIGASDIAAIAGQSKYSSPWDVYKRLTERADLESQIDDLELGAAEVLADQIAQDDERDLYTRTGWGHRLEPVIRQAYADETDLEVVVPSSFFHRVNAWARATPDGIANAPRAKPDRSPSRIGDLDPETDRLVQCKNVGQFVAREWADAPPDYVQLQEQWELYVTGLSRADVAALIGGGDFQIFTVWRDDQLIEDLVTIAEDFWRRVQDRRPPDVDGSDTCRAQIAKRLADAKATELVADVRADELARRYQEHYLAEAAASAGKKLTANQLLSVLADAGATKLAASVGTLTTRRVAEKTVETVDWEAVARELGARDLDSTGRMAQLIVEHTTATTKPQQLSLVAPRAWSDLKKGTAT